MKCKMCGRKLHYQNWTECGVGIAEYHKSCDYCGYYEHWAYGYLRLVIGDKTYFEGKSNNTTMDNRDEVSLKDGCARFDKVIRKTRKYYKRVGRFVRGRVE